MRFGALLKPLPLIGLMLVTGCGAGGGQSLTLAPVTLDFGDVETGDTESLSLRIYNGGRGDVLLVGVDISGEGFGQGLPLPYTLIEDQESSLPFTFSPDEIRTYDETLTLIFEDDTEKYVPLLGRGTGEAVTPTPTPTATPTGTPLPGDLDGDGYNPAMGDCNEQDASINPGAEEICGDTVDQDCSGNPDDGPDADQDGFIACGEVNVDCDDSDGLIYPGAAEICDGFDQDCDGEIDEDFDADGDGVSACAGDCDDNNPSVAPGFIDGCLPGDNDCDGEVDEDAGDVDGDGTPDCEDNCPLYVEASDAPVGQTTGAPENPFPNILAGIQNRGDCGTIWVLPGSYAESITFPGTDISLVAIQGPDQTVITGNGEDAAVSFEAGQSAESILDGFTLTASGETFGSCLKISNASPTIRGNTFSLCEAAGGGGAVYVNEGSPTFENNIFSENRAPQGGAVMVDGAGATFTENSFSNNEAFSGEGGAVYLNQGANTSFSANTFTGNTADGVEDTQGGGALAANGTTDLTFQGNVFEGNDAVDERSGGAIHLSGTSNVTFTGDTFTGNTATGGGGAINVNGGDTITFSDITVKSNVAGRDGGGIRNNGASPLVIQNSLIQANTAISGAGISAINPGYSELLGLSVLDNISEGDGASGAGISYSAGAQGEIRHCFIARNSAGTNGGGIYTFQASPTIRNNIIVNNFCSFSGTPLTGQGGGIYMWQGNPIIRNNTIVGNDSAGGGGGVIWSIQSTGVRLESNIIAFNVAGDGVEAYSNPASMANNNVFENNEVNYSGSIGFQPYADQTGTNGNISEDPGFTDFSDDDDYTNDDFTLSVGSSSIDAGSPSSEFNDADATRNDIGAFGGPFGDWTPPTIAPAPL